MSERDEIAKAEAEFQEALRNVARGAIREAAAVLSEWVEKYEPSISPEWREAGKALLKYRNAIAARVFEQEP